MDNVVRMKLEGRLPKGIDSEVWEEFVAYRRDIKREMTERAERMMLKRLVRLMEAGEDPNECMEQTMSNGKWWNVYSVQRIKSEKNQRTHKPYAGTPLQQWEARVSADLENGVESGDADICGKVDS